MDDRKDRIGEHAAEQALPWAINALGPMPSHPVDRLAWQRRAASIGAYRELYGHDDPADPIGPEPAAAAAEKRASWYEALAALGPVDGPDVRGMPDGRLLHLRDTYPIETAWAPQYVGDELRQVRAAAWDAGLAGLRAAADDRAAEQRGDHDQAAKKHKLAASRSNISAANDSPGSQGGSQHTQAPGYVRPQRTSAFAGERHAGLHPAMSGDGRGLIHTEEVTGSIPVSPTSVTPGQKLMGRPHPQDAAFVLVGVPGWNTPG